MKTQFILAAFRNAATPAARLAAWQNRHPVNRRKSLADYYVKTATLAERRTARIKASGPELSLPGAENPFLWLSGDNDPEVLETFAGRGFLKHQGWFSYDGEQDTLETYAIRLKRFPRLMFYAVKDSMSGDLRVRLDEWEEIDFSECSCDWEATEAVKECANDLVRSNDSSTEREAEKSREYYERDRREQEIEENKNELKTLRGKIRALAHELKSLCPSPAAKEYPAAASALRASLAAMLRERGRLMELNQELAASL